jgi:muramidase (phage lysozyme)
MASLNSLSNDQLLQVPQVRAFLDMIGISEGANYQTVEGGGSQNTNLGDLSHYQDHPHNYDPKMNSTAAGKYQFIKGTWASIKAQLGITGPSGFDPHTQDLFAVQQLRDKGAIRALGANDFAGAVKATAGVWASFPGNTYNQHAHSLSYLQGVYQKALADAQGGGSSGPGGGSGATGTKIVGTDTQTPQGTGSPSPGPNPAIRSTIILATATGLALIGLIAYARS